MSKEKQIDEMAKVLCEDCARDASPCSFTKAGIMCDSVIEQAEALYNAGYRKSSDVAREIERYLRLNEDIAIRCKAENGEQNEEYWKGKLSAFRQIRGFIDAELKKKYTEDGE